MKWTEEMGIILLKEIVLFEPLRILSEEAGKGEDVGSN